MGSMLLGAARQILNIWWTSGCGSSKIRGPIPLIDEQSASLCNEGRLLVI